jgi:hypothetical protein
VAGDPGVELVEALVSGDFERAGALLDPDIDLRGMTPSRFWEAKGADAAMRDVFRPLFDDPEEEDRELIEVSSGAVESTRSVRYRVRARDPGAGRFVYEQIAYYRLGGDDRVSWMRLACSGTHPVGD